MPVSPRAAPEWPRESGVFTLPDHHGPGARSRWKDVSELANQMHTEAGRLVGAGHGRGREHQAAGLAFCRRATRGAS